MAGLCGTAVDRRSHLFTSRCKARRCRRYGRHYQIARRWSREAGQRLIHAGHLGEEGGGRGKTGVEV